MANQITFTWDEINQDMINLFNNEMNNLRGGTLNPNTTPRIKVIAGPQIQENKNTGGADIKKVTFELTVDLLEDLDFDVASEFDTAESDVPFVGFLTSLGRISSLIGGTEPSILNIFKVPTWRSTGPLKLQISPILYTRSNAVLDVYIPGMSLTSMSILKKKPDGSGYRVPGVYLGNVGRALSSRGQQGTSTQTDNPPDKGKTVDPNSPEGKLQAEKAASQQKAVTQLSQSTANFVRVRVPGLLNLGTMFLSSCKPKWSRHKTESGIPLWCALEMQLQTFLPAADVDLFSEIQNINGTTQVAGANTQSALRTGGTIFT